MRADDINSHVYPVIMEMTAPSSHVCSTNKDESKGIIVHKSLLQNFSADEDKSKGIIVKKTLSQSFSADKDDLCFTKDDQ